MSTIGIVLGAKFVSWAASAAVGLLLGGAWMRSEEGGGMPETSGETASPGFDPDKTQPSIRSPLVVRDVSVSVPVLRPCIECDRGIYTAEDGSQGVCLVCEGKGVEELDPAWCVPSKLSPLGGTGDDDPTVRGSVRQEGR